MQVHLRTFAPMKQTVTFTDLGTVEYKECWDMQEELLAEMVQLKTAARIGVPNTSKPQHKLLFVEHPPVFTLGKSGKMEHVLLSDEDRVKKGIEFFQINRGGDITYHGPGQLVGYPIFDLEQFYTDIGKYLRNLEEVIIRLLESYGLKGERSPGETGVWLQPGVRGRERKICAIGVRCSRWVTMHGFAFNVNTNLDHFNFIIPCGIQQKQVTSLQKELDRPIDMEEVKERTRKYFEEVFQIDIKTLSE